MSEAHIAERISGSDAAESEHTGMRRLPYLLFSLLVAAAYETVKLLTESSAIITVVGFMLFICVFVLLVKRMHNIGFSGWRSALLIVPVLNLLLLLWAYAFPENYSEHKKLDLVAKYAIVAFVLIFILSLIAVGSMFGALTLLLEA